MKRDLQCCKNSKCQVQASRPKINRCAKETLPLTWEQCSADAHIDCRISAISLLHEHTGQERTHSSFHPPVFFMQIFILLVENTGGLGGKRSPNVVKKLDSHLAGNFGEMGIKFSRNTLESAINCNVVQSTCCLLMLATTDCVELHTGVQDAAREQQGPVSKLMNYMWEAQRRLAQRSSILGFSPLPRSLCL